MYSGLLIVVLAWFSSPFQKTGETLPKLVKVENAQLKTLDSMHLPARIAGVVGTLDVTEGSVVGPGQSMGKILDRAAQLQVDRARIAIDKAKQKIANQIDVRLAEKRLAVASNELERAVSANQRIANTYPAKEVDRLQLVVDTAKLEIERAEYDRELARQELRLAETELLQAEELLERHAIKSATGGIVVKVEKRPGEWVEPGTNLVEVVQTSRLRIEGFVRASAIRPGLVEAPAKASIKVDGRTHEVDAKLTFISPESNPVNGQVRVFLEIDNSAGLFRPGMTVETTIGPAGKEAPDE